MNDNFFYVKFRNLDGLKNLKSVYLIFLFFLFFRFILLLKLIVFFLNLKISKYISFY